jgi:hypothetical protein
MFIGLGGHGQHLEFGVLGQHLAGGVDAVEAGQQHVEDHQVGMVKSGLLKR